MAALLLCDGDNNLLVFADEAVKTKLGLHPKGAKGESASDASVERAAMTARRRRRVAAACEGSHGNGLKGTLRVNYAATSAAAEAASLLSALPSLMLPDGSTLHSSPPPPSFYMIAIAAHSDLLEAPETAIDAAGDTDAYAPTKLHLSCVHFYEAVPAETKPHAADTPVRNRRSLLYAASA
eukprot:3328494-Pleurochrysis_carterae.AAC.3